MSTTTLPTRRVTVSERKAANVGQPYLHTFLGLTVAETTWDGSLFIGTVTAFTPGTPYAIITAPTGSWTRAASLDLAVLLDEDDDDMPPALHLDGCPVDSGTCDADGVLRCTCEG